MPTANVLLQLWKGGWRVQRAPVIVDNLRIEAALGTGALDSPEEAERVAIGQLALYAEPIVARTVAVEPVGPADTPWLSHTPGQTVTEDGDEQLVESLAFRRDNDGHVAYFAELDTHIDTPEERFELALKKMANGTLGGTSRVAQPVNLTQPAQLYRPSGIGGNGGAPFIVFDRLSTDTDPVSKFWTYRGADVAATELIVDLPTANVTTIDVLLNGVVVESETTTGGTTERFTIAFDLVDGDNLAIGCVDLAFEIVATVWFG